MFNKFVKQGKTSKFISKELFKILTEVILVVCVELTAFHLVKERATARIDPAGDEGSWMMVATQIASGEGFTTRWLEHPFLTPTTLPRPDDFRYPGLTYLLAAAFSHYGVSYQVALDLVTLIFLIFLLVIYCVCRMFFGRRTAVLTMTITAFSLLQLTWNSQVYTEGLFGISIGCVIACSIWAEKTKHIMIWIALGVACGCMYYVRPNGLLFMAGIPLYILYEKNKRQAIKYPIVSTMVFLVCIVPWLYRNFFHFGNPFHIATNAGLFRGSSSDPLNLSVVDFIRRNGVLFPVKAFISGILNFFKALDFFEHGLQILPCIGVIVGIFIKVRFYSRFVVAGTLLTFASVCYASYNYPWAGVRYFSSLLPYVYGYGIFSLLRVVDKIVIFRNVHQSFTGVAVLLVLIWPVVYPHRYYERTLPSQHAGARFHHKQHIEKLGLLLNGNDTYLASSAVAGLAYLSPYKCISLHDYFDSVYLRPVFQQFSPDILVLTVQDTSNSHMKELLNTCKQMGYEFRLCDTLRNFIYYQVAYNQADTQSYRSDR